MRSQSSDFNDTNNDKKKEHSQHHHLVPESKLAAVVRYVFHCVLPLVVLVMVTPVFFLGWAASQLLSFFAATQRLFYRLDNFFWSFYQRLVLFFAENWTSTDIHLYGDVPSQAGSTATSNDKSGNNKGARERIVFICNHQCSFDWIIADILAVRHNCLGNIRYVLKNSLRYIPLFGYFFKLHGCIYVKRGGHDDSAYRRQLDHLAHRGIYWLVIFPEGTRFRADNKKMLEINRNYAEKYKLPTFDLVLTPKHRGFHTAMQMLDGNCDAVYDITIAYEPPGWTPNGTQPKIPSMASYLSGSTKRLHVHLKRIPISEIPKEEPDFLKWLCERFRVKDEILGKFYKNGGALVGDRLPPPSQLPPFSETIPYLVAGLLLTLPLLITETGRSIYCFVAILSSLFTVAWMAFAPER